MLRLVDQPRPTVWAVGSLVSPYYRALWEMRSLPDWQRLALRRATFVPGRRFLYIHAPKAASSSIHALLRLYAAAEGEVLASGARHWRAGEELLSAPDVYRFSFVLHPVTRALAAFDDLFVRGRHAFSRRHWPHNLRAGLRYGDASSDNFSRYLDYVADAMAESAAYCDPHLRQQVRNLQPEHIDYARIGRVERLAEDAAAIFEAIGLGDVITTEVLAQEAGRASRTPAFDAPTTEQIARIGELYRPDFEAFGYAPDR